MEEKIEFNLLELFSQELADAIEFDKEFRKALVEHQVLMSAILEDYLLACGEVA